MKLTDALLGEHAVLYVLFDHARNVCAKSDDVGDIRGAVAPLELALLSHARIEETLLFPGLEPHLGEMGPLAVMRSEHQQIDDLLDAARQETEAGALKATVGRLLDVAQAHFGKEEQVLFQMARQVLDEAALTALGDQWAMQRNVMLGG